MPPLTPRPRSGGGATARNSLQLNLLKMHHPPARRNSAQAQRSIILADTSATSGSAKLSEVCPTSARKPNAKLREVEQTSASKIGRGGATSHVNVACRVTSEFERPERAQPVH